MNCRQLKQEKKRCMEELQCNIVVMKRSRAKILRLNLDCSNCPAINEIPSCSDEELPEDRIKHSTPISSPEIDRKAIYSRLLKNTASTLGGLYLNESPSYALEWGGQTYLNKLGRSFSQEVDHFEDAGTGFSSDDENMSPAPSHPLFDTRSIRRGTTNSFLTCVKQSNNKALLLNMISFLCNSTIGILIIGRYHGINNQF